MLINEQMLKNIAESPDDDGLRLAYADWLEKQGEANQAAYIRLALAIASAHPGHPELPEWKRQAGIAERTHARAWAQAMVPGLWGVSFRRGFPEKASIPIAATVQGDPGHDRDPLAAMDRAPLRVLRPMIAHPVAEWEETISDPEALDTLLEEDPSGPERMVPLAVRLASDPRISRATELNLEAGPWGEEALRALFGGLYWHRLETLTVSDWDSQTFTAEALAACPSLERLTTLEFQGDWASYLGDKGATVLAGSVRLAPLRTLRLLNVGLGPAGMQALASSPHLTGLTELDLGDGSYNTNMIGPEGAEAIAHSEAYQNLTQLILNSNDLGDEGLAELTNSSTLTCLEGLSLKANDIGDEGLHALAQDGGLPRLSALQLTSNEAITGDGVAALAESGRLRTMKTLWLGDCPSVGAEGARALARSPHGVGLRYLDLRNCGIDPDGATALADSPHLNEIEYLDLRYNPLDHPSTDRLQKRFGDRARLFDGVG
jgi:uncharacterized protein (TIGR02996 family)